MRIEDKRDIARVSGIGQSPGFSRSHASSHRGPQTIEEPSRQSLHLPIPILLTVRELNFGGIERDVTKIALKIDRTRFEPHVASYQLDGMRFDELMSAGIPVLHVPFTSWKSRSALISLLRLRSYIRKCGIRLVHSYDTSAVFFAPAARALGVPAVLSSTLGDRALLMRRYRRRVRWTDKLVDKIVVNCDAMRRHMINDEHFPGDRIKLCYNGVDTQQFYPQQEGKISAVAGASLVIGTVCVLRPEKALEVMQGAFARIRHLKPNMKMLIVGGGPELSKLQENARRLGLEDSCIFIPATPDVQKYLRALDIFVSCSYSEAFSNSILEAMACGICVVGSNVGGTPELIHDRDNGLLFRSGDVSDLAGKLASLIENDGLRRKLGARAAEFARTTLSIDIAAQRVGEIYELALRQKMAWGER